MRVERCCHRHPQSQYCWRTWRRSPSHSWLHFHERKGWCSYLATWWDIGFHFPYLKGTFFKNLHFNGTVPFTLIRCEHLQIDTEFSFFVCLFFPYFPFRSVYTKNHKKYFVPFKNVFWVLTKGVGFVCLGRQFVWLGGLFGCTENLFGLSVENIYKGCLFS